MNARLLIICRLPDPHVDAVCAHLPRGSWRVWDLNRPATVELAIHVSDRAFAWDFDVVWWRYKNPPGEHLGTSTPAEAFQEREWLQTIRGLAAAPTGTRWVNNPVLQFAASQKLTNLVLASRLGMRIPQTLVTNDSRQALAFLREIAPAQAVFKPLTFYVEAPDITVFTSLVSEDIIASAEHQLRVAPALFQERILKDYELRVTIIGDTVFATRIDSQKTDATSLDWRRNQGDASLYSPHDLPNGQFERIVELHRLLGLEYGAYDFVVDPNGFLIFLEVNPGGQWLWLEHHTGQPISLAMAHHLFTGARSSTTC